MVLQTRFLDRFTHSWAQFGGSSNHDVEHYILQDCRRALGNPLYLSKPSFDRPQDISKIHSKSSILEGRIRQHECHAPTVEGSEEVAKANIRSVTVERFTTTNKSAQAAEAPSLNTPTSLLDSPLLPRPNHLIATPHLRTSERLQRGAKRPTFPVLAELQGVQKLKTTHRRRR